VGRIEIRNLAVTDIEAINEVLTLAYGPSPVRKATLRRGIGLQPDGWFVALRRDGAPVGMVGAVDYGPFAYIGLMAVHPDMQRQGIAMALMQRLLSWLDARGCPLALLDASKAGAPLYVKLGFVDEDLTLRYQAPSPLPQGSVHRQVRLLTSADIGLLAAFDTPIFGADRSALLGSMLSEYPDRCLALFDDHILAGYVIAQPILLGPWLARTPEEAEVLLRAALTLPFGSPPAVIVSGSNLPAGIILDRSGFTPQPTHRHMYRGNATRMGCKNALFGLSSYTFG
jgi:GNAT superfamily N-acetyltransferase